MKILRVFPEAKHCRHAAGSTAFLAMITQIVHFPHIMEPLLFGVSALLTVYEPLFVQDHVDIVEVPHDHEG